MTADSTDVADDGCRLLRASTLAHDQAGVQVLEIEPAQLLDRYGFMIELPLFRRIFATRDLAEENPCLVARKLGRPEAMQPDGEAARAAGEPVVNNIAALAGGVYPKTEARQFVVPDEVISLPRLGGIRGTFCEFWHVWQAAFPWRTRQGSAGNGEQRSVPSPIRIVGEIGV